MPHELEERCFQLRTFAHTVTMQEDSIEGPDEFVTDWFESVRNVPCQFGTYNIYVIGVVQVQ